MVSKYKNGNSENELKFEQLMAIVSVVYDHEKKQKFEQNEFSIGCDKKIYNHLAVV